MKIKIYLVFFNQVGMDGGLLNGVDSDLFSWIKSTYCQKNIDYYIVSNNEKILDCYPESFSKTLVSDNQLFDRLEQLGFDQQIISHFKERAACNKYHWLCDIKPYYNILFPTKSYRLWGWVDYETIFSADFGDQLIELPDQTIKYCAGSAAVVTTVDLPVSLLNDWFAETGDPIRFDEQFANRYKLGKDLEFRLTNCDMLLFRERSEQKLTISNKSKLAVNGGSRDAFCFDAGFLSVVPQGLTTDQGRFLMRYDQTTVTLERVEFFPSRCRYSKIRDGWIISKVLDKHTVILKRIPLQKLIDSKQDSLQFTPQFD